MLADDWNRLFEFGSWIDNSEMDFILAYVPNPELYTYEEVTEVVRQMDEEAAYLLLQSLEEGDVV